MSVSVALENPRSFNQESLILIGAGAASGVLVTGLNFIAGAAVPQLSALTFGAILGLSANLADHGEGTPMLRLILSIMGGVLMALLLPLNPWIAAGAGGLLIGSAFALREGDSILERFGFWLLYGLALAAAVYTTNVLSGAFEVAIISNLFQGATWGLFLAFAAGLKRLRFSRDPLLAGFKEAEAELVGDEWETVRQGRILYEQIVQELERPGVESIRERAHEIAQETSRALVTLSKRSSELHVASERIGARRLGERVVELDRRVHEASDKGVQRELEATLDEMLEQVRVRRRLEVARARLGARQQRCFTALERLHLSLVQAGSSATNDIGVHESIENLENLSEEMRWRNLSVEELVSGVDDGDAEVEADILIEELKADLEAQADSEAQPEEEGPRTVLDSGVGVEQPEPLETDSSSPPETDGSVGSPKEEELHVEQSSFRNSSS